MIENALLGIQKLVVEVVTSNLFETSLIAGATAALGAYFGARGAQKFAERSRKRNEIEKEIRATNKAISLAYASFNTHFGLKCEIFANIKKSFDEETKRFFDFEHRRAAGDPTAKSFNALIELKTVDPFPNPNEQLRDVVFDQLSVVGRPINLVATLSQATHSLNQTLVNRREFIRAFKAAKFDDHRKKTLIYLGLLNEDGSGDETHRNLVDSMCMQNDSCIMFSKMLVDDLKKHGEVLQHHFVSEFGEPAPSISTIDLSTVKHPEMMPDPNDFKDWENSFTG
ncbi:hypothetical protein KFF05_06895 [bacterium SCSIO 12827]|nr:hypothetical protein KFF05_06895 [bacterium SCSIO 12827]